MKVAFYTLGCKLNQCESEALAQAFLSQGFFVGTLADNPQIILINTCTVTSKAEQKARGVIKKTLRDEPQALVLVTGCYAQMAKEELEALDPRLIVVERQKKSSLLELPQFLITDKASTESLLEAVRGFFKGEVKEDRFAFESQPGIYHTRSFIKIQDGCNNACRYCRVTLARGSSVSLPIEEVVRRVLAAEASGAKEVVLTGVNLCQYESEGEDLASLIERLTGCLTEARLRVSSLEPNAVNERLVKALSHPTVCPHFHLALQSGSTSVLRRMDRHYDAPTAATAVSLLRSGKTEPFIAADVITGYDGETQEEFNETLQFVKDNGFNALHVFPFSPRPGTAAAHPKNPVPERLRDQRAATLRHYSQKALKSFQARWQGQPMDIVVEEVTPLEEGGFLCEATSERYLRFRFVSTTKIEKGERLKNFFSNGVDFFS